MPTYAYACTTCEHRFEVHQSFSDTALTRCPECEGRLRKLFNTVGIVFKGSGFYRTDSRSGSTSEGRTESTADSTKAGTSESGSGSSGSGDSGGTKAGAGSGAPGTGSSAKATASASASGGTAA